MNSACPNLALPEAAYYLFSSIVNGPVTTPELKPPGLNLTSLKQEQIDWLLSRGVLPAALIQPSPIMTCRGERAKHGRFDENHEGCVALKQEGGGFWLNKAGGPFVCEDANHAHEVSELLGGNATAHEIFFPKTRRSA